MLAAIRAVMHRTLLVIRRPRVRLPGHDSFAIDALADDGEARGYVVGAVGGFPRVLYLTPHEIASLFAQTRVYAEQRARGRAAGGSGLSRHVR